MKQLQAFWDGLDPRRRLIAVPERACDRRGGLRHQPGRDRAVAGHALLRPRSAGCRRGGGRARGRGRRLRGRRHARSWSTSAARDRIRMALAAKGLPAGGPAGYEILDNLSGFGTTSQMFDAAYWRAKEGELARTITGSPERARRAGAPREPGVAAVLEDAGRVGLGHGDHGARRARPRPGRGDPLPGLLRGCRASRRRRWR